MFRKSSFFFRFHIFDSSRDFIFFQRLAKLVFFVPIDEKKDKKTKKKTLFVEKLFVPTSSFTHFDPMESWLAVLLVQPIRPKCCFFQFGSVKYCRWWVLSDWVI